MFDLTLTFDNGPEPETTPFVLDVLARRSICATFFLVGRKLNTSGGRELAQRAHAEGHWIGNHTWTHSVPLGLLEDARAIGEEIRDTQKAIGALAHPHRFFRPFGQGGNLDERLLNPVVVDALSAERMSCVLWNAIPGDWKEPDGWVDRALAQCRAQAWTVMVLHDLPTGAMRNLERFLDAAVELGVRLRQDFAPECVPILDGRIVRPIDHIFSPFGIEDESQRLGRSHDCISQNSINQRTPCCPFRLNVSVLVAGWFLVYRFRWAANDAAGPRCSARRLRGRSRRVGSSRRCQ